MEEPLMNCTRDNSCPTDAVAVQSQRSGRQKKLCLSAIACILLATLSTPSVCAAAPKRIALLIGVSHDRAGMGELHCDGDVKLIHDALIKRGFDPDGIMTLVGPNKTTRTAVLQAIRDHLIGRVMPGDIVYLHFSGRGIHNKAADGKISELVLMTSDADVKDLNTGISLRELSDLLRALRMKRRQYRGIAGYVPCRWVRCGPQALSRTET